MKKTFSILLALLIISIMGIPVFAQGSLPIETLPDGTTNNITKGRDIVNAYRDARVKLASKGWYKGIDQDCVPLLNKMVSDLRTLGYAGGADTDAIDKFFTDSDNQNAKDLGYQDTKALNSDIKAKFGKGGLKSTDSLKNTIEAKWK